MKWIEILRKDNYALLQSEDDTEYAVVSGYNPNAKENQQWNSGVYFIYWNDKSNKAEKLQTALDYFRSKTESHFVDKGQKYLEVYRENYSEYTFLEMLQTLNLNDDEVGESFGVYCIIDENSLR